MTPKKTLSQREAELRALLATPEGRAELDELAARYMAAGGGFRPGKSSVVTYIIVCERTRGLIDGCERSKTRARTMTIYGLSQTTGVERTLLVEKTGAGFLLHSRDEESYSDLDRIVVPPDLLLAALIDRPAERSTIRSASANGEARKLLDITVRGNEVQLWVRTETGNDWEIAVGFDDFQDALEQASDAE